MKAGRVALDFVGAAWHALNFLAPAFATAVLSASLAKVLWRSELRGVGWTHLCMVGVVTSSAALLAGLMMTGHDGRMTTYAGMVAVTAVSLWWFGFRPFRR